MRLLRNAAGVNRHRCRFVTYDGHRIDGLLLPGIDQNAGNQIPWTSTPGMVSSIQGFVEPCRWLRKKTQQNQRGLFNGNEMDPPLWLDGLYWAKLGGSQ